MADDIIGMADMGVVFAVTDALGVDRELISVPLEKEDPGSVKRLPSGELEIVVPLTVPQDEWAKRLMADLKELGF
jgi:hypothetical protein